MVMKGIAKLLHRHDNPMLEIANESSIIPSKTEETPMGYVTTGAAAKILGVEDSRIRQLLLSGTLRGKKFGHVWMVEQKSIDKYAKSNRKPGPKVKKTLTKNSTKKQAKTP
jgi:hypothetical protein